jgi:Phage derived protein Gp49-like (DUF891).
MEVIVNDFSLTGQFQSCDEFIDYMLDELCPILDLIIEKQIPFLKKQDFYDNKITEKLSLNDIFQIHNDPAITKIRNYIIKLAYHKPYWGSEARTDKNVNYSYPSKGEEPNCFTETIERKDALFSFPLKEYETERFQCYRNDKALFIQNITGKKTFFDTYLMDDIKNIRYILERYPFEQSVILAEIKGKCYAEEALLNNNLKLEDMQKILMSLPKMIEGMGNGKKNKYWDSLRDEIFEFRIDVSDNRAFRLLFFHNNSIVFVNGFIKKTQKTPKDEIEKAIKIKKDYLYHHTKTN